MSTDPGPRTLFTSRTRRFAEPVLVWLGVGVVLVVWHTAVPTSSFTVPLLAVSLTVPMVWILRARMVRLFGAAAVRLDRSGVSVSGGVVVPWDQIAYVEIWRRPAAWWWLFGISETVRFVSRAQADFAARADTRADAVQIVCRHVEARPDTVILAALALAPRLEVRELGRRSLR